ncbi:unnamed protein product [Linum trigynum]|uniref:Uncharacterized protein n=1 Tax=Linum trigynum TaxID=586398 RepID=A0AAV2CEL1_9ROSI
MVVNPTHLADLTGRILSIARPVHNDDGTMLVIVKIENIRNAIVAINWITTVNDFYSWAETQEMMYPVVVTFMSILVYEPEPNFNLLLTSTNATRLIRGSYIHRYKALLNRYFHEHRTIMILSTQEQGVFLALEILCQLWLPYR